MREVWLRKKEEPTRNANNKLPKWHPRNGAGTIILKRNDGSGWMGTPESVKS